MIGKLLTDINDDFEFISDVYGLSPQELVYKSVDFALKRQRELMEGFLCLDCRRDTSDEYYMVHDELWIEANPDDEGMLCVLCLERRLGRRLTSADFTDAPVNDASETAWHKSDTLVDRLTSG